MGVMADPGNPLVDPHLPMVLISFFFGLTVIFGATLVVFWVLDIGMLGLADPMGVLMDPILPMGLITWLMGFSSGWTGVTCFFPMLRTWGRVCGYGEYG